MKRIFAKLHLWLAIPFGIVITILCLTGAILVFESEIKQWTQPSIYKASQRTGAKLSLEELMTRVAAQLPDTVSLSSIQVPSSSHDNYRLGVAGQGRASIMVDPYTGEVKGEVRPYSKGSFFTFIRKLHRWFLFEMKRDGISLGKMITGTTTLVFVLILLSGIIIWIPKTMKGLKRRMSVKIGAGRFRFWYDIHLALGKYASLILLVMALTGLTWSFNWYRNGFYKVFGVEITQNAPHAGGSERNAQSAYGDISGNSGEHGRQTAPFPALSGQSQNPDNGRFEDGRMLDSSHPNIISEDRSETANPEAHRGIRELKFDFNIEYDEQAGTESSAIHTNTETTDGPGNGRQKGSEGGLQDYEDTDGSRRGSSPEKQAPAKDSDLPDPGERFRRGNHSGSTVETSVNYSVWEQAAKAVIEINPRFRNITVQEGRVSVSINRYGNTRASDVYSFDKNSGEITGIEYYRDRPKSAKIRGWIYAVHVGSWGGLTTKIIYFIVCLIGAVLPITGYYIWLKKRWKRWTKKGRQQQA